MPEFWTPSDNAGKKIDKQRLHDAIINYKISINATFPTQHMASSYKGSKANISNTLFTSIFSIKELNLLAFYYSKL